LKTLGEEREWCPYFMTRHLLNHATIVVYNYQYMLDPKVSSNLGRMEKEREKISGVRWQGRKCSENVIR
jgi:DNA excision repair protein ERCC-2